MDLVHSTFQASFNARIERLAEQEANELRTIFRYFDTDDDGAVSADQTMRLFGLLGLDINPAYVRDLEEVYLAEFLKIVDTNVPMTAAPASAVATPNGSVPSVPPLATSSAVTASNATAAVDPATLVLDEVAQNRANAQLWEDEWRAIDSYRRGFVSRDELRLFLRSCFSPFPPNDLDRFLELYADPTMPEDSMTLTKTAFLKFRHDYTMRERAHSEHDPSSDDEDGEGDQVDVPLDDPSLRPAEDENPVAGSETETKAARIQRANSMAPEAKDSGDEGDGGIVIDPGVMDDEFVDDDDVAAADHDTATPALDESDLAFDEEA